MVKDIEPKYWAKGSTKGGKEKTSQFPHMIHLISHLDPMIFNYHHIKELSE